VESGDISPHQQFSTSHTHLQRTAGSEDGRTEEKNHAFVNHNLKKVENLT